MTVNVPEGFRRACQLDEVSEPGSLRVEFDDIDIAVVRSEGEVYAIEDVCSHAEVALSEGEVEGATIECWMHGSCFDLCTGAPTNPPATEPVDVFDIEVIEGDVYVRRTARSEATALAGSDSETARQTNGGPILSSVLKQREQATS